LTAAQVSIPLSVGLTARWVDSTERRTVWETGEHFLTAKREEVELICEWRLTSFSLKNSSGCHHWWPYPPACCPVRVRARWCSSCHVHAHSSVDQRVGPWPM